MYPVGPSLVPGRWRDYSFTHIVEPGDDLGFGCGVGPDVAVEVDVVALSDVGRHQAAPQLDRNNRRICKQRVFSFEYSRPHPQKYAATGFMIGPRAAGQTGAMAGNHNHYRGILRRNRNTN